MMESCCPHIQLSQTEIKKWALIRQNYFTVQQKTPNCVTSMQFTEKHRNTLDFASTKGKLIQGVNHTKKALRFMAYSSAVIADKHFVSTRIGHL